MFRHLEIKDYHKNYPNLLKQLNNEDISYVNFENIFQHYQLNPYHSIYVQEHNNQIIVTGSLLIEYKFIHGGNKIGHIEDIIVDKDFRGQKLGYKIVQHLINMAFEQGCYKVILNCDEKLIGFYNKLGFKKKSSGMALYFDK